MIVLGVLLVAVAAAVIGFVALAGNGDASLSWQGLTVDATRLGLFAAGGLTLLVLQAGLLALRRGVRRRSADRRELSRLRAESREAIGTRVADLKPMGQAAHHDAEP